MEDFLLLYWGSVFSLFSFLYFFPFAGIGAKARGKVLHLTSPRLLLLLQLRKKPWLNLMEKACLSACLLKYVAWISYVDAFGEKDEKKRRRKKK